MEKRPTEMVYCPYCERKVRPLIVEQKKGLLSRFFTSLLLFFFYLFTLGVGWLLVRTVRMFCNRSWECPICGAILKKGNYGG